MKASLTALALLGLAAPALAVTPDTRSGPLYEQVAGLDRALFDAYNARDLEATMARFSDDLEFYHDKSGVSGKAQVRQGFTRLFAQQKTERTLVPGSLEVWPLGQEGAIERGRHTFCHEENGKPDCGTFEFVHVWRKQGDTWKLARVVSFGH